MDAREGWASEFARDRSEVTYGETDLRRLLIQRGIDPSVADEMPPRVVYTIMQAEAFILSRVSLHRHIRSVQAGSEARDRALANVARAVRVAAARRDKALEPYLPGQAAAGD